MKPVLNDVAEAIANLDIPVGEDALVEAIALRDQLDARITKAVATLEAGGWWGRDASTSMVAWLRAPPG